MGDDLLNMKINFGDNQAQNDQVNLDFTQSGSTQYTSDNVNYAPPALNQSQGQNGYNQVNTDESNENSGLFDLSKTSHPMVSAFHLGFKAMAIISYLFFNSFLDNKIMTFIIVMIFSACDFWTVKNVSGRLLVGLRWWSEIKPDGTEKWHFQSHPTRVPNAFDRRVFWWSQKGAAIFWAIIVFFRILGFDLFWLVCSSVQLSLTATNYYGYYKCSKDQQASVGKQFDDVKNKVKGKLFENLVSGGGNGLLGLFGRGNSGN